MASHYYQTRAVPAAQQNFIGPMTKPLPKPCAPESPPDAAAQFWVHALHALAQPTQAMALFAQRLRQLDVDAKAAPVVQHLGASVQDLQRTLQVLVEVAQIDAGQWVAQAQEVTVEALHEPVRRQMAAQVQARGPLWGKKLRWRNQVQQVFVDPALLQRLVLALTEYALERAQGAGVLVAWRSDHAQNAVRMELWWGQAPTVAPALGHPPPPVYEIRATAALLDGGLALYAAQRLAQLLGCRMETRWVSGKLACLSLRMPAAARRSE